MNEKGKTVGEVSRLLGKTRPTIGNYCKHFRTLLSESATQKTRKRFTDKDIETLTQATTLLESGYTYQQAFEWLQESEPVSGEVFDELPPPEEEPAPEPEPEPRTLQTIEFFTNVIEQLTEEHQASLQAKDEHLETLRHQNERLNRQLAYERLPWFRRLFKEPPE